VNGVLRRRPCEGRHWSDASTSRRTRIPANRQQPAGQRGRSPETLRESTALPRGCTTALWGGVSMPFTTGPPPSLPQGRLRSCLLPLQTSVKTEEEAAQALVAEQRPPQSLAPGGPCGDFTQGKVTKVRLMGEGSLWRVPCLGAPCPVTLTWPLGADIPCAPSPSLPFSVLCLQACLSPYHFASLPITLSSSVTNHSAY